MFLRRKSAHQRTIVVEGVPKEMRSDSKLFTYFNTLYPEEVRYGMHCGMLWYGSVCVLGGVHLTDLRITSCGLSEVLGEVCSLPSV